MYTYVCCYEFNRALKLAVSRVAVTEFNSLYVAMKLYSHP